MVVLDNRARREDELSMLGWENEEIRFYDQIVGIMQKILNQSQEFNNLFERLMELIQLDDNVYSLRELQDKAPQEVFSYIVGGGQGERLRKELRALILAEAKGLKS